MEHLNCIAILKLQRKNIAGNVLAHKDGNHSIYLISQQNINFLNLSCKINKLHMLKYKSLFCNLIRSVFNSLRHVIMQSCTVYI